MCLGISQDPEKRAWVASLGPDVVYVSGRVRKKGEMNGKSGNMNNCTRQLYPAVCIPICVPFELFCFEMPKGIVICLLDIITHSR